jgi:ferredoxin
MPLVITEPYIGTKGVPPVLRFAPYTASIRGRMRRRFPQPLSCLSTRTPASICGLCVDECPVKAIFREDDVPLEWKKIHPDHC